MIRRNNLVMLLWAAVISVLITPIWSICNGKYSGKYFLSNTELTYKDAKQCCYKQQMEIFRITSVKDIPKILDIVNNGHKTAKIKRFSFWIKKDSSRISNKKEINVAQKCPLIQWSTLGNTEPWTTYGFCGLQYHVICAPTSLKKYKAVNQGQLTFGKRRRKRQEPDVLMDLMDERATCSLSATLNGYYISGSKLSFASAKSCCASKNMELVNSNFTDLEAANLKHSLCHTFRDKSQPLWISSESTISSLGQSSCSSLVLEDGEYLREQKSACDNLYPALCESPEEDPETCQNIQYKELEGGAYLFSNLKVPFSQASICCREQNMNLVNLYSYKESSAMYQIMLQNGLDNENLNFWTSGSRKFSSNDFRWHDGQPIILPDFTEFCIAALEKLNAKSFMVTDYGCERLLNFLCIDKDIAKDFSRKRSIHEERVSKFKQSTVNDGFVTRIRPAENSTIFGQSDAVLPLKKMIIIQQDLPPLRPLSTQTFRSRKLKLESSTIKTYSQLAFDNAKVTDAPTQSPQPAQTNDLNLVESLETPKVDTIVQHTPSITASRWQYKTCNQVKDLNPIVSISGSLSVTDALKMVMLNKLYDMKSTPSVNMGSATWKKKYINQLGRIFTEVCDDEDLISKKFINVMMGLNSVYQSSFTPGPIYDTNMWDKLYKDLVNCKPKKIDLLAHAYEIYAMVEKEAFTSPDTVKQLFPPEELADKSIEEIDPIIDALWWMTTTAHAACYKQTPSNDSVWATQFKTAMQKDFFEPVNYRWRHSGRDYLYFGAIVGDYNLERMVRNMRYCATAAYWQSKMINRELVRGLNANPPALFQVNSGRPHDQVVI